MEKKTRQKKQKIQETSKTELAFVEIEKEPCETCKDKKDIEVKFEKFTKQEMDLMIDIVDKYGLSVHQVSWIYNLYNRVFNTNKQPGCGKCFVNIGKQLKARYRELYG